MIRPTELHIAAAAMALAAGLAQPAQAVVLTGEVRSVDAQPVYTPASNSSPVVIRYFVPEGQRVKRGDVVLRIDPGQSAAMIPDLEAQIEQARAKTAKEVAALEVKAIDADVALADAEAELATAKIDASIPRSLASALDYDKYQGELDRTDREVALKRRELATARAAIARREADSTLEVQKLVTRRDYHAALVRTAEVRAERDGVVLHGFNKNWLSGRIDEGSSTMPGSRAGEITSGGAMQVRAWALEPDRRGLQVGQAARLDFDALPGQQARGRIASIAGAPDARPEWGAGRYFTIDIDIDPATAPALLPGMSVRVLLADADATSTVAKPGTKK